MASSSSRSVTTHRGPRLRTLDRSFFRPAEYPLERAKRYAPQIILNGYTRAVLGRRLSPHRPSFLRSSPNPLFSSRPSTNSSFIVSSPTLARARRRSRSESSPERLRQVRVATLEERTTPLLENVGWLLRLARQHTQVLAAQKTQHDLRLASEREKLTR